MGKSFCTARLSRRRQGERHRVWATKQASLQIPVQVSMRGSPETPCIEILMEAQSEAQHSRTFIIAMRQLVLSCDSSATVPAVRTKHGANNTMWKLHLNPELRQPGLRRCWFSGSFAVTTALYHNAGMTECTWDSGMRALWTSSRCPHQIDPPRLLLPRQDPSRFGSLQTDLSSLHIISLFRMLQQVLKLESGKTCLNSESFFWYSSMPGNATERRMMSYGESQRYCMYVTG
ncbi:hypothetical protein B0T21DRAFT_209831 [Apiosordaria backusii]|uniref:Uncharacterized protein n=1 Tax=Apiosordaria backusii TaxID=314023 RepID=A0AA40B864_9PEZI|nr:hypothetical protein B0T21DRAFT_209831 [Apiosordaria backusii]